MPDGKLETIEPDPAATSIPNDQPVNKVGSPEEQTEKPEAESVSVTATAAAASSDKPSTDTTAKDTKVETAGMTVGSAANDSSEEKKENGGGGGTSPQKRRREDDGQRGSSGRPNKKKRGTMFDPTVQDITDDPLAIRKQVEFYFSDANLARDKYLFELVGGAKNNGVDLKTIHAFKRMRRFQPYEAVVKALRESTLLDVTDDEKIQRTTPLSADFDNKTLDEISKVVEDEAMARTVYVKGFGYEKPSTQFDIEAWFTQFGMTNQVRLRRFDDRTFKGSVFVEFDSEETAKNFLALDPKPKFGERELIKVQSKKQYCDDKVDAIKDGILESDGRGGFKKTEQAVKKDAAKKDDKRDWRERREEDRKNGFRGGRGGGGGGGRGHRGNNRGGRGGGRGGGRDRRDRNEKTEGGEAAADKQESSTVQAES